jgi:hypothetical protein
MAEMIIMLRRDSQTGKQSIIIKLHSDPDALPHEHEQMHRELVEKALGRKLEDAEEIVIERESAEEPAAPASSAPPQERRKQGQGR